MCRATNPTTVWTGSSSYVPTGGIETPWYSRSCIAVSFVSVIPCLPVLGPTRGGTHPSVRTEALIHVRSVEHGRLSVWLPRHDHESSAGGCVCHREALTWTQQNQLWRPRRAHVGSEGGLALQHVGEALELGWDRCLNPSTVGQFDVEDQRRRPQAHGRALADQDPNDGVALAPRRDLFRLHHLGARFDVLVLPGQVHPEQHAAELRVAVAFLDLVGSHRLGMPRTSTRPEREERPLGQPSPLRGSSRPRGVTGAGRALQHVPEVVESSVGMFGVLARHL